MKTTALIVVFLAVFHLSGNAQRDYSDLSLYFGYGKLGVNIRLDLEIADKYFGESSTRLYLEGGGQGVTFEQKNFLLGNIAYPSDCRVLTFGVGLAQEFHLGQRGSIMPYAGFRYEYARFKSQELIDAIGDHDLQRYADTAMTMPIGPPVENSYGDASAFDIGCRLGIALGKHVELSFTGGYSNIRFDTASTLFGQYRGQAPYENPYWIKRSALRFEGAIRINFYS